MKLKLDEIKVESFVTSHDPSKIIGGDLPTAPDACGTNTCQRYTKVGCDTTPEQCAGYTQIGCGGTVGCTWQGGFSQCNGGCGDTVDACSGTTCTRHTVCSWDGC